MKDIIELPMEEASHSGPSKLWMGIGALSAFFAVALGAFGAHALRPKISAERMEVFQTGAHYHLVHSLAIMIVAVFKAHDADSARLGLIGPMFLAGILLFSGSLYLLAIAGIRAFGAITPVGGICFLAAWALLAITALRNPRL